MTHIYITVDGGMVTDVQVVGTGRVSNLATIIDYDVTDGRYTRRVQQPDGTYKDAEVYRMAIGRPPHMVIVYPDLIEEVSHV